MNAHVTADEHNIATLSILIESGNSLCIFFAAVTFLQTIFGRHWHPEEPQDALLTEETAVLQTPRVATTVKSTSGADDRVRPA